MHNTTNADFLSAIIKPAVKQKFYSKGACLWVCSKPYKDGSWSGAKYTKESEIHEVDKNNYFCVSLQKPVDGILTRGKKNFDVLICIVLDDIGTKALEPPLKPSWVIETSKGNEQWGYILSTPIDDASYAEKVIKAIARAGYTDKGAKGLSTRYMRLPVGSNDKPEHVATNDGKPYPHKLLQWSPKLFYTVEEILDALEISLCEDINEFKSVDTEYEKSSSESDEELIRQILTGESYHDPLLVLSARYQSRGIYERNTIEALQGVMKANKENTERWKSRYADIPRAVRTAFNKYAAKPRDFKFVTLHEFLQSEPPRWFVKNLLPEKGVAMLYGQSGAGKSFVALDMVSSIVRGVDWCSLRAKRGRVVYVVTEGRSGFSNRIKAYLQEYNLSEPDLNITLLPETPDLTKDASVEGIVQGVEDIGGTDIIVIDTLAQVSAGVNENSAGEMGEIIRRIQTIQEQTDSLILLVHHAGKNKENGARGSSVVFAAMDAVFDLRVSMIESEKVISFTVEKQKDAEAGTPFTFRLKPVTLGVDEDGDCITSCVVEFLGKRVIRKEPGGKWQKRAYEAVKSFFESCDDVDVPVSFIIDKMVEQEPYDDKSGKKDSRRDSAKRAISELSCRGWFEISNEKIKLRQNAKIRKNEIEDLL